MVYVGVVISIFFEFGSQVENCHCWKFSHFLFWAAFKITVFGELDKDTKLQWW